MDLETKIATWSHWSTICGRGAGVLGVLVALLALLAWWVASKESGFKDERNEKNILKFNEFRIKSEQKTADLQLEAERARLERAKSDEKAAQLEQEAESLKKQTAEAKLKLAQIQMEQARIKSIQQPRLFNEEQANRLIAILTYKRKEPLTIQLVNGDLEADNFATQLRSLLDAAGYASKTPPGIIDMISAGPNQLEAGTVGIIEVREGPALESAQQIFEALQGVGFKFQKSLLPQGQGDNIVIKIQAKGGKEVQ